MAYDPIKVASYFLHKAELEGQKIDPLKLQKLVYYAHGWHLAIFDKPLINRPVEAWDYGPVVPPVYHAFKQYGARPITDYPKLPQLDEDTRSLLDQVWNAYGRFSGIKLANMTHAPDAPWRLALDESRYTRGVDIPDELMTKYFRQQAARGRTTGDDSHG